MRRIGFLAASFVAGISAGDGARAENDLPLKFSCVVRDAQILHDRTHVRCANKGLNGLSEFAAETNQPYAGRVVAAIVQALRTGTALVLTYAPSAELNPEGCSARNCRKIIDVGGNGRIVQPPAPPMPPLNAPEPQVEPADFDPVDSIFDEFGPGAESEPQAPSMQPAPPEQPMPVYRPMSPILN